MNTAFIGIGTNLGDRQENINKAIKKISEECSSLKKASLYETEPVGIKDQPWFLNTVIKVNTNKEPVELFHFLKNIEKELGREETVRNGPRIIDLDILFYNDTTFESEEVTIPHKRLHERAFVLAPLTEIEPESVHPTIKKTALQLYQELETTEKIRKLSE